MLLSQLFDDVPKTSSYFDDASLQAYPLGGISVFEKNINDIVQLKCQGKS